MADRTATVHLRAVTTQYQRAMKDASEATDRLITKAGGMDAIGGKMQQVGGTLTRSVTLPLALAGGAAVKFSTDFETAFASLVGLAGVPKEEIDGLKESVMDLAGETGRAPQELADALYFAASAGLDAAGAMDAVSKAARGAAAGLGNTTDIVGLVASATASYGAEAINAAKAVDILTATIREGRADPDELASTLGRVLPIASQLGVTFDEVGGTVAYLSNVFGDTNRTVTATQGLLVKLLSPSQQGKKALEQMGTSVEELHGAISEDGLLGALDLLRERGFAGNQEALAKLFDDIEGRQAAIALLADKSGSLATTLEAVGDSAGAADSAFATMAETAGFKNQQAFAQLQTALIQVGDVLVPLVANAAEFAALFLEAFNSLPGPAQTAVVALGGLLAATGPLMTVGGKLVQNWHALGRGFDAAATGAYTATGKIGTLAKVAGSAVAVFAAAQILDQWTKNVQSRSVPAVDALTASLLDLAETGEATGELLRVTGENFEDLGRKMELAGNSKFSLFDSAGVKEVEEANAQIDALDKSLASLYATNPARAAELFDELTDAAVRQGSSVEQVKDRLNDYGTAVTNVSNLERAGVAPVEELADAHEEAVDPVQELEDAIKGVTNAIRAQLDPLFAAQDAMLGHKDAEDAVKAAQMEALVASQKLEEAIKTHGKQSDEAALASLELATAQQKVKDADDAVVRSALDVAAASAELKARVDDGSVSLEAAEAQLRLWVEQGLITAEQAHQTAEQLRGVAGQADQIAGRNVAMSVQLTGYAQVIAQLDELSRRTGGNLLLNASVAARDRVPEMATGGIIPGRRGGAVPMIGHAGEGVLPVSVMDAMRNGNPMAGAAFFGVPSGPSSSVSNGPTYNVTVNNPAPFAAPDQIRRELRRAQLRAM